MKLEKLMIAQAASLSTAILWTICTIWVALLPDFTETIRAWIMHGSVATGPLEVTFASYLMGGLTLVIISWVWGYVFGWAWEFVSRKS